MTLLEAGPVAAADLLAGFDRLELWVGNARAAAHWLAAGFGFTVEGYAGPETGVRDRASYLLGQGGVRLVVTAGLDPEGEVQAHATRHGDGVRFVDFAVAGADPGNVGRAFDLAVAGGARPLHAPRDEAGVVRASVAGYGDTVHRFVARRTDDADAFSTDGLPEIGIGDPVGLGHVDHVVGNVPEGSLDGWIAHYRAAFGFRELTHFDRDQISTEYSALRSTVLTDGHGVTMPVNEPAPGRKKSQIQEYLDAYGGPGVQHVAFGTDDIVASVGELRRRGVRFLTPPATYYEDARARVGHRGDALPWADLERLGILVDVESTGLLLQVFTETFGDRPTLFFEVIQRQGAQGFGEGNFKALFEAIEREQARRGNL